MDYRPYFKGKKITVMGLGLLGRGVGDAKFLAEQGAHLTITDLKSSTALRPSFDKLRTYKNIEYVLGKHRLEDFRNKDFILKAAGVPIDSPYIKEARKNKIPVEMSATIFAKFSKIPMIGITGTRGKSTVTHMIAHILESAGKKVVLGGNVRGVSNLELLKKANPPAGGDVAVFELDSWQLQGFGDNKTSPGIAVFTTFYPDHMAYYGKKMKRYFTDKANIFKYQKKGDVLVAGSQAMPFIKKWGGKTKSKIISPKSMDLKLRILGGHNLYNASLAISAVKAVGIKEKTAMEALQSFKGVEGRLQFVREVKGVKYYNDTTATTPEATIAALRALGDRTAKLKNIVLILGGSDKSLDMRNLIKEIPKYTKSVVLLPGTGTDRLESGKLKVKSYKVKNLEETVKKSLGLASRGDIILLSPAFASFGMFKNEYDRGDQFMKIVKQLK